MELLQDDTWFHILEYIQNVNTIITLTQTSSYVRRYVFENTTHIFSSRSIKISSQYLHNFIYLRHVDANIIVVFLTLPLSLYDYSIENILLHNPFECFDDVVCTIEPLLRKYYTSDRILRIGFYLRKHSHIKGIVMWKNNIAMVSGGVQNPILTSKRTNIVKLINELNPECMWVLLFPGEKISLCYWNNPLLEFPASQRNLVIPEEQVIRISSGRSLEKGYIVKPFYLKWLRTADFGPMEPSKINGLYNNMTFQQLLKGSMKSGVFITNIDFLLLKLFICRTIRMIGGYYMIADKFRSELPPKLYDDISVFTENSISEEMVAPRFRYVNTDLYHDDIFLLDLCIDDEEYKYYPYGVNLILDAIRYYLR